MVSREEYNKYINELVKEDTNNENLKYLKQGYSSKGVIFFVFGVLALFCGFGITFGAEMPIGALLLVFGVIFIILGAWRTINSGKANKYYKDNYRGKIIGFLLKDEKYSFDEFDRISERIFKESQFAGYYEDYEGRDKLIINIPNDDGSESNCDLSLCDLKVTKTEEDDEGNETTVTVYSGVFGYIYFPFEFKCVLCIDSSYRKSGVKLEKVNLEDISFNKKFKIYSDNQIESRYILTPKMMENLLRLEEKFNGVKITLVGNKMYIGFAGTDLLELGALKDDNISTIFDDFYDEIEGILNLVNEIKTNNKVFKM